jgi:hypothetical protein
MESESALDSDRPERLKMCQCKFSIPDSSFGEVAYIIIGKEKDFYRQIFLTKMRLYCPKCGIEYENSNWGQVKGKRKIFSGETIALQNRGIPSERIRRIINLAENITFGLKLQYFPAPPYHHIDEYILRKKDLPTFERKIRRISYDVHRCGNSSKGEKM